MSDSPVETRTPFELVRRILHEGPMAAFLVDTREWRLRYASPNAEWILGFPPERFLADAEFFMSRIHPDDHDRVRSAVIRAARSGDTWFRHEFRFRHADGAYRWVREDIRFERDETGETTGALGLLVDITEIKRARFELRRSEEDLRRVGEFAEVGRWWNDIERDEQYWSPEFCRMLGVDMRPGASFADFLDLVHPDDRESFSSRAEEATRLGVPFRDEVRIVRPDGETRWIESFAFFEVDESGEPRRVVGLAIDVTERRGAEQAARRQAERLMAILQAAPIPGCRVDPAGRVVGWNVAAERVFGWREEEIIGRPLSTVRPEDWPDFERLLERAAREIGGFTGIEARRVRRDGASVDIRLSAAPIPDETGSAVEILLMAEDITRQKQLERRIAETRHLESIARLAGGVAHDLNNMLTTILGYAELTLADPRLPDELAVYLREARGAGLRSKTLVAELLASARRQPLEPERLDLGDLLAAMRTGLRSRVGTGIAIEEDFDPRTPAVHADRRSIENAVERLVDNAREAMPEGGRLTLRLAPVTIDPPAAIPESLPPGDYAELAVVDEGTGMTPEVLARAFEPFFTTRPFGVATGMGLAVVRGIVEQSGGAIEADSRPGEGTTFRILLPSAGGEPATASSSGSPST